MARFEPKRSLFLERAGQQEGEDTGDGLPTPFQTQNLNRRTEGIAEAKAILNVIPEPGQSLHAVCTARMDLTDIINHLLDRLGPCSGMGIATLGYHARNLKSIIGWLDSWKVAHITFLASKFFRSHNGELWEQTQEEFKARGCPAACAYSHCKVITLAFKSGQRLTIEGSANLCGNGSGREQMALVNDRGLHDWHLAWISQMVKANGG